MVTELNNELDIKCNTVDGKIKILLKFSDGSTINEVLVALELSKRKVYTMLDNFITENGIENEEEVKAVYNMNIKGLMSPEF